MKLCEIWHKNVAYQNVWDFKHEFLYPNILKIWLNDHQMDSFFRFKKSQIFAEIFKLLIIEHSFFFLIENVWIHCMFV